MGNFCNTDLFQLICSPSLNGYIGISLNIYIGIFSWVTFWDTNPSRNIMSFLWVPPQMREEIKMDLLHNLKKKIPYLESFHVLLPFNYIAFFIFLFGYLFLIHITLIWLMAEDIYGTTKVKVLIYQKLNYNGCICEIGRVISHPNLSFYLKHMDGLG